MHKLFSVSKKARRRAVILVAASVLTGGAVGIASAVLVRAPAPGDPLSESDAQSLRTTFVQRLGELGQVAEYAPAEDSTFEVLRVSANGRQWEKAAYRNTLGESCELLVVPGEGRGYGCSAPSSEILVASWGSRQIPDLRNRAYSWDEVWVTGTARPPVRQLQLVLTDCSVVELPLTKGGAFLGVIEAPVMHSGLEPHSVRGLNAAGRVIAADLASFPPATVATGKIGPSTVPGRSRECD